MVTKVTRVKKGGEGGKGRLRYLQMYVADPAKVLKDDYQFSEVDFKLSGDFTYDINDKPDGGVRVRLVGGYRCEVESFPDRVMELRDLYLYYRKLEKDSGPIAYHIVLSWPSGVRVSDEDVYRIGCLLLQALGNHPAIIAAHIEPAWDKARNCWRGEQKHCHIVVSAYPDNFDTIPHKLRVGRGNSRVRELADRLAIEYKQGVIVAPDNARAHGYAIAKGLNSWIRQMRDAAEVAASEANDMETYAKLLAKQGYILHQEEQRLIYQLGEHFATDRSLGRPFTRDGLSARWKGEEFLDEASGCLLDEVAASGEDLFVSIPLGGNLERTQQYYQFNLHDGAVNYSDDVLRGYFPTHMQYAVTDSDQKVRCEVSGQQILDYLGVGVDGDAVKGVDYEIAMKRLDRAQERVRRQIEKRCESQLWAQDRELARALRWQDAGGPHRIYYGEHEVVYYNRNPDGSKKTIAECVMLMLCYYCIPDFPLEDYCQHETVRPVKRVPDNVAVFGPIDPWLQAGIDAMQIEREEGIESYWDLYTRLREAEIRYETVAEQLAEVNEKLLRDRELYSDLVRCRKARYQLRRLQRGECEDLSEEERKAIVSEYEDATAKVKTHIGGQWPDWERIINNYHHLLDVKVTLQQAVYAEYERMERLRFVEQQRRIEECRTRLEIERDERRRALPKPSLNLIIQTAEEKCDKQALARGKRQDWEI